MIMIWYGIKASCTTSVFISLKMCVVIVDPDSREQRQTISHYTYFRDRVIDSSIANLNPWNGNFYLHPKKYYK